MSNLIREFCNSFNITCTDVPPPQENEEGAKVLNHIFPAVMLFCESSTYLAIKRRAAKYVIYLTLLSILVALLTLNYFSWNITNIYNVLSALIIVALGVMLGIGCRWLFICHASTKEHRVGIKSVMHIDKNIKNMIDIVQAQRDICREDPTRSSALAFSYAETVFRSYDKQIDLLSSMTKSNSVKNLPQNIRELILSPALISLSASFNIGTGCYVVEVERETGTDLLYIVDMDALQSAMEQLAQQGTNVQKGDV